MLCPRCELPTKSTCSPSKHRARPGWILGLMSHPRVSGRLATGPPTVQMPHLKQQMMLRKQRRSWEAS